VRLAPLVIVLTLGCSLPMPGRGGGGSPNYDRVPAIPEDEPVGRVLADYVGLWRRETMYLWQDLFLSTFTAASTNPDGTVSVQTRDQFFSAQQRNQERVVGLRQHLENVRVERIGRLATVWADFVVTGTGERQRGKLVMLLIPEAGSYKIHSLVFTYGDAAVGR
jgi:hypothetical protein